MLDQFVCEAIEPVPGSFDAAGMAGGAPGLPREFVWRGRRFEIGRVTRQWHETGPCRNGSPEMYVRKHYFEIVAVSGETMKLFFERQPRRGQTLKRWWLATVREA